MTTRDPNRTARDPLPPPPPPPPPAYDIADRTQAQIDNVFVHHPPSDAQIDRFVAIRCFAKHFATLVAGFTPASREQERALEKIEESVMWANAAIARNEPGSSD